MSASYNTVIKNASTPVTAFAMRTSTTTSSPVQPCTSVSQIRSSVGDVGVAVGSGVCVGTGVGVSGTGVYVGAGVGVSGTGVKVGTGVGVSGIGVNVGTGVGVSGTGVEVGTGVGVSGTGVYVGAGVGVSGTGVNVGTGVGVSGIGVKVGTGVGVSGTGVNVGTGVGVSGTGVFVGTGVGVERQKKVNVPRSVSKLTISSFKSVGTRMLVSPWRQPVHVTTKVSSTNTPSLPARISFGVKAKPAILTLPGSGSKQSNIVQSGSKSPAWHD